MSDPTSTCQFLVASLGQTELLAADLAGRLRGGEVIVLEGDLGAGKTAFVRGLVKSLGGPEASSPSFTIENIYPTSDFAIHHYDFYRLSELGVDGLTLTEVIGGGQGVVLIEWADLVRHLLDDDRLEIRFQFDRRPAARRLTYQAPSGQDHLLPPADLLTGAVDGPAD